jgi:hypothetical protein
MGIVSEKPESGVRIAVERPTVGGAPWRYHGAATTTKAAYAIVATIDASLEVTVEIAADAPPDLAEKVRLLLRAAARASSPPPRKIVRWRPDAGA